MTPHAHGLRPQSVRLTNGIRLNYVVQGPAAAPALLLIHGYPDSWHSYAPVLTHLPPTLRAIAVSLRGFGDSDKPAGSYHTRDMAADLAEFLHRLRIPAAYVVGHSMGTHVANFLALDHPELVLGLIQVGSLPPLGARPEMDELLAALDAMQDAVDPGLIRDFQRSTLAQPLPEAFFEDLLAESAKAPLHVWRQALHQLVAVDFTGDYSRLQVPVTLFWGDQDGMSSLADQLAIARSIPGGELRVYAGAGHSLQWEEPRRFATDLAALVADLERVQESANSLRHG
jgi:pimeloyl-ACP methyl ester carboxylesterase